MAVFDQSNPFDPSALPEQFRGRENYQPSSIREILSELEEEGASGSLLDRVKAAASFQAQALLAELAGVDFRPERGAFASELGKFRKVWEACGKSCELEWQAVKSPEQLAEYLDAVTAKELGKGASILLEEVARRKEVGAVSDGYASFLSSTLRSDSSDFPALFLTVSCLKGRETSWTNSGVLKILQRGSSDPKEDYLLRLNSFHKLLSKASDPDFGIELVRFLKDYSRTLHDSAEMRLLDQ